MDEVFKQFGKNKLSNIFLRKEGKQRDERQREEARRQSEEAKLDCSFEHGQTIDSPIKITVELAERRTPVAANFSWTLKTPNGNIPIEGHNSSVYYPCLEDAGAKVRIVVQTLNNQPPILLETPHPLLQSLSLQHTNPYETNFQVVLRSSTHQQLKGMLPIGLILSLSSTHLKLLKRGSQTSINEFDTGQQIVYRASLTIIESISVRGGKEHRIAVKDKKKDNQQMIIGFGDAYERNLVAYWLKKGKEKTSLAEVVYEVIAQKIQNQKNIEKSAGKQFAETIDNQSDQVTPMPQALQETVITNQESTSSGKQQEVKQILEDIIPIQTGKDQPSSQISHITQKQPATEPIAEKTKVEPIIHQPTHETVQNQSKTLLSEQKRFLQNEVSLLRGELKAFKSRVKPITVTQSNQTQTEQLREPNSQELAKEMLKEKNRQNNQVEELQKELEKFKELSEEQQQQIESLKRKLNSLAAEKSIENPRIEQKGCTANCPNLKKTSQLETQLKCLQQLLKHKSGDSNVDFRQLQQIINNLAETITDKDEELFSLKRVNKELLEKLKASGKTITQHK